MKRIPEPELMLESAQAKAYAEADFSEPNDLFLESFRQLCLARPRARLQILDLGCGPAEITISLARMCPDCGVHGVDGSKAMLEFGRSALRREPSLADRVILMCQKLPSTQLARAGYDAIVSNSLLHHLHDPFVLWNTVLECAKPGANVLVMDLLRPASEVAVDALVETYAMDAPEVLRTDFRNSLFAAYTLEEVEAQIERAGLGGVRVEIISDRHFSVSGHLEP